MELTHEDIRNILALISVAPIKGAESATVLLLQQKLSAMLEPKTDGKDTTGKNR